MFCNSLSHYLALNGKVIMVNLEVYIHSLTLLLICCGVCIEELQKTIRK